MNHLEHLEYEIKNQWYDEKLLTNAFNCSVDDLIVLPERVRSDHENYEEYANIVSQYLIDRLSKESWNKKIIFYLPSEGFATNYLRFMHHVVKNLLFTRNVEYKNLYYITGAADVEYNRYLYYKHCITMGYIPMQICFTNPFEGGCAIDAHKRELHHNKQPYRKKKILFFNKQPRAHRLAAVAELMKRGLKSKTYLSFVMDKKAANTYDGVEILLPKTLDVTKHFIKQLLPSLPLNLSLVDDGFNMHQLLEMDLMLFRNSLFSLVSETLYSSNVDYKNDPMANDLIHCFECTFHTEKTWKVIRAKHPFVMLSTPQSLKGLRDLGYKTFHPYINETYDEIYDDQERFYAVMDEVERLANMSEDETRTWLENVQPIAQYNFDLLKTKDYFLVSR